MSIVSKMMRMAGRSEDGRARALSVTNKGQLEIVRGKVETVHLLSNEVIPAGGSSATLNTETNGREKEVWIFIANDAFPLLLTGNSLVGEWSNLTSKAPQADNFFPAGNINESYGIVEAELGATPKGFLYFPNGLAFKKSEGETPESFEEVRRNIIGYNSDARIRLWNQSEIDATVSLWVVKVYG